MSKLISREIWAAGREPMAIYQTTSDTGFISLPCGSPGEMLPAPSDIERAVSTALHGKWQEVGGWHYKDGRLSIRVMRVPPDTFEIICRLIETLAHFGHLTDSFCENCSSHAPKDVDGNIIGQIKHAGDCAVGSAFEALKNRPVG